MADESKKRAAPAGGADKSNKKSKVILASHILINMRLTRSQKQWRVPRKVDQYASQKVILPGDHGIWATCDKGREGKCTGELRDLFNEVCNGCSN